MRKVNIKNFQKYISEELRVLPFTVTRRDKPVAVVLTPESVTAA